MSLQWRDALTRQILGDYLDQKRCVSVVAFVCVRPFCECGRVSVWFVRVNIRG